VKPYFFVNQGDAIAWLEKQQPGIADLVITDPAYASLEKHRKRGTTTRLKQSKGSSNEWFPIFPNVLYERFFEAVYRILKKDTHFYVQCDVETMFIIKPIAEGVGFRFWNEIIWDKMRRGMGYHYAKRTERILFFEKGKRNLNSNDFEDLLSFPRINGGYPTEKPPELLEVFVKNSSAPGQLVVDPFMGSGSTGLAALRHGRVFWGNDIQTKAVELSKERFLKEGFREAA
jgi:site-specific DNA-methyltransferase (adenine-specific)